MENIPIDKTILQEWLQSGYIEQSSLQATTAGIPQGAIISPALANMTLDGIERTVRAVTSTKDKVNVVRYADDFVVTGISREILKIKVKPAIESFLSERGLQLSTDKTKITHIDIGFDFLGFNIRKYNNKLLIKPSKKAVKKLLGELRKTIKSYRTAKVSELLHNINPKILGWCLYYRHVVSKAVFNYVDKKLFEALVRWIRRRHPNKSAKWMRRKYFREQGARNWIFSTKVRKANNMLIDFNLIKAALMPIRRHIKIKAEANPYDPKYFVYFTERKKLGQIKWP